MEDLVSIVVPVYKCENFIEETINNIKEQLYTNWELLLVNDCSPDNSKEIIENFLDDKRIKLINHEKNSGAGVARNTGIENASGRFLCFLDSDDQWEKDKLSKQVEFMKEHDAAFSFTGYQFCDENCKRTGAIVKVPETMTYKQALKNTTIFTSTVMFDLSKLTKEDIKMPDVRKGQDSATWWKVLKKIDKAYGLNENLVLYRRTNDSLSANKWKALKRTWNLYRNVEHLNIFSSLYCFFFYAFRAVVRRI